jgi:PAS domain-containing protein
MQQNLSDSGEVLSEHGYDQSTGEWRYVAERKRVEKMLKAIPASGQPWGRDIILFIRRNDGRILEANEAAIKSYGYSRDELVSLKIYNLRGPKG